MHSLKTRYRQNLKTLKVLDKQSDKTLCNFEDSDEEERRIAREYRDNKIAKFTPQIGYRSSALTAQEATYLLSEIGSSSSGLSHDLL